MKKIKVNDDDDEEVYHNPLIIRIGFMYDKFLLIAFEMCVAHNHFHCITKF